MTTRTRPAEGVDHESILPAEAAAPPIVTFWTVRRLESKFKSKLTPVTSVPLSGEILIGIEIPVSPGSPDPLLADRLAPLDCARPAQDGAKVVNTNKADTSILILILHLHLCSSLFGSSEQDDICKGLYIEHINTSICIHISP